MNSTCRGKFEVTQAIHVFLGRISLDLEDSPNLWRTVKIIEKAWRKQAFITISKEGNLYYGVVTDVSRLHATVTLKTPNGEIELGF